MLTLALRNSLFSSCNERTLNLNVSISILSTRFSCTSDSMRFSNCSLDNTMGAPIFAKLLLLAALDMPSFMDPVSLSSSLSVCIIAQTPLSLYLNFDTCLFLRRLFFFNYRYTFKSSIKFSLSMS